MARMPAPVTVVSHPLVQHKLSLLRDVRTGPKEFRELAAEVTLLLAYEAMRDLETQQVEVETPLQTGEFPMLAGKKLAVVAILRAGLIMSDSILRLVPAARVGHIGLYRDPQTLLPVAYYSKLPPDIFERRAFLLDPMLATGGSAVAALDLLKAAGAQAPKLLCILAAPQGVEKVHAAHPDAEIITAALDAGLTDHGYIYPGLGDAGDRIYGTQ